MNTGEEEEMKREGRKGEREEIKKIRLISIYINTHNGKHGGLLFGQTNTLKILFMTYF